MFMCLKHVFLRTITLKAWNFLCINIKPYWRYATELLLTLFQTKKFKKYLASEYFVNGADEGRGGGGGGGEIGGYKKITTKSSK